jgi:hypothetical protein
MRKIGYVPIFLACTLNPHDPAVTASVAPGGGALELRKGAEGCRLELDCKARAAPASLSYDLATLKGLKTPPVASQITLIKFDYADGTSQSCKVTGAKALD